ncbi:MAG: HNH endonuclease signature motif containing protein [Cyanobacteriota bacterium]|nr:HNH endonuclease signature motif containing protein [Cyanobacteriota bacterium]
MTTGLDVLTRYIPAEVDWKVRTAAQNRCGFCLSPQHLVMARLEIEHIIPLSKGSTSDESNLWLACPICNRYKSDKTTAPDPHTGETVSLFNPRTQVWADHFTWSEDGIRIVGKTAMGRATVAVLHLDTDPDALEVRRFWVLAGWHPPES